MTRYVLRRIAHAAIVVWAAYTITFLLLYVLPSDPVAIMMATANQDGASSGGDAAEQRAVLEAKYGFDQPVYVQYATLLFRALSGDFGSSIASGRTVLDEIGAALPGTLQLAGLGLAFGLVLGVLIAIVANLTRSRRLSRFLFAVPPFVAAVPTFLIALLLLQLFAFEFRLVPSRGSDGFAALILPAATLGIAISAPIAQVLGGGIRQTLREPFVDVLRTKGLSRWGIQIGHVLRNASIPALTILALIVGSVFSGAVIIETVYSRAGIGRLLQQSVDRQDIPIVQAIVIVSALAYALVNLAADLVHPLVDPRIRRAAAAH